MKRVKVPSVNRGYSILIDQCPSCGGLWFDRFEMTQIPHNEALKIDSLDQNRATRPTPINKNLLCPKDHLLLVKIKDINIPPDTNISRCRKCEGVWFSRGELVEYKKHIQNRQKDIAEFTKKYQSKVKMSKTDKINIVRNTNRLINTIGYQLMPMPIGLIAEKKLEEPFILSNQGVEVLKELPQAEKMKVYQMMAREHKEDVESEKRFINATLNILNIIMRLLLRF